MFGEKVDVHHPGIGQIVDVPDTGQVRYACPGPDVEKDLVGLQGSLVHLYDLVAGELRVATNKFNVLHARDPGFDARVGGTRDFVFPGLDAPHVDGNLGDVYAEACGVTGRVRYPGAAHQGLRGNAADIDAGTPHKVALHNGGLHACPAQSVCECRASLARTYYDRIETFRHADFPYQFSRSGPAAANARQSASLSDIRTLFTSLLE